MESAQTPSLNLDKLSRKTIRLFYILSPIVAVAASWIFLRFTGRTLDEVFSQQPNNTPWSLQTMTGLLGGTAVGLFCGYAVLKLKSLAALRRIISAVFEKTNPPSFDLVFTAVSAGFSEELFFRGALQPVAGLWGAALLFALCHGVGPKSKAGLLLFGLFVFTIGVGLGLLYEHSGLIAAMSAHASLDLTVLLIYKYGLKTQRPLERHH